MFNPIPTDIGRLSSVSQLFLQTNSLSGSLPSQFGLLSNMFGISQSFGALLTYVGGYFFDWRMLCWVLLAPNVISTVAMHFMMAETPYFLATKVKITFAL